MTKQNETVGAGEKKISKTMQKLVAEARALRNENGVADLSSKFVAKIVRERLKCEFPGVKFSVRSDFNSIRVDYTDGPVVSLVNDVVREYSFGGFDGMIDMAYSKDNWLLPDGSMSTAKSEGTTGSRGVYSPINTDCPAPGAFIVDCSASYVYAQRDWSDAWLGKLIDAWEVYSGIKVEDRLRPWNEYVGGNWRENLTTLLHRHEERLAEIIKEKEAEANAVYVLGEEHFIDEYQEEELCYGL